MNTATVAIIAGVLGGIISGLIASWAAYYLTERAIRKRRQQEVFIEMYREYASPMLFALRASVYEECMHGWPTNLPPLEDYFIVKAYAGTRMREEPPSKFNAPLRPHQNLSALLNWWTTLYLFKEAEILSLDDVKILTQDFGGLYAPFVKQLIEKWHCARSKLGDQSDPHLWTVKLPQMMIELGVE